ncbi:ciliated left-right organizer metallopeptidase [Sorex fumeus]|uniref:ciliated left-right organizer metallopeptidase n=1 Tax=Sorex fumeus TaxID=62283 RepID=UPI0024AD39D9|nr:ciliated left-right organizer metallopeptidase [Sorex fumeus]
MLLLPLLLLGAAAGPCLHREAQESVRLLRAPFPSRPRVARSASLTSSGPRALHPLRIHTCYLGDPAFDRAGGPQARGPARALAAVREAAQQLQGVLAVSPVPGPLLLSRDPAQYCRAVWGDPETPNFHRCSLLNPTYKGESCLGAKIPDAHLRGFALWPEEGPPQLAQPDGPGIPDTDFLLYVRVAYTFKCHQEPSVIAYAACCQLDPDDRPLAGTIVFCAPHLTSARLSHRDIVTATLHELLHALGFSGRLFKKWRDCPSGPSARENCSTRRQVTRRDKWGQLLLTTPKASHTLARHLGVRELPLGVPLEDEGPLSSHWEARLLQGSIMTATFDGAHRTRLDPITLAAFQDSGWYQVNHSAAEELLWGQGAGLEFGLVTTCGTGPSNYFCTGSGLGCHYLHLDKGRCSSDPLLEGCRMYKPLASGSECWKRENGFPAGAQNPHGEIHHWQSRCFLANVTSQRLPEDKAGGPKEAPPTGRCYLHQCKEHGAYDVQVAGAPWTPCLPGQVIQIPGYNGLLICPRDRLCRSNARTNAVTVPPARLPTRDRLLELSGLAGPPGLSLGEEERQLSTTVLPAVASTGGAGRFLATSDHDHNSAMTHGALSTGLCLMLVVLVGALGTRACRERGAPRVGPSPPNHSPELPDTKIQVEEEGRRDAAQNRMG